jgi:uncharacterized protein
MKEERVARKRFISAEEQLSLSFQLGDKLYGSGFRPRMLATLWRGGAQIGLCVQEYYRYFGIEVDHIAVRTSLYTAPNETAPEVKVHGEQYIVDQYTSVLTPNDPLLLVDDILESGRSAAAVIRILKEKLGPKMPLVVRIATLFIKSAKWREGNPRADYYMEDCDESDEWLVFPHELQGLTLAELLGFVPDDVYQLIEGRLTFITHQQ